MPKVVLKHLASTIHSFSKCQWPARSSGHSLPTQGHSIGAVGQLLAASLIPKSRAQTVRTDAPLVSVFVLQAATFSALLPVYFTPPPVFQRGFDRCILGTLKILHRCLDAATGFCGNMQNIHGMLEAPSVRGPVQRRESGTCADLPYAPLCIAAPSGIQCSGPSVGGASAGIGGLCPPGAEPGALLHHLLLSSCRSHRKSSALKLVPTVSCQL